MPSTTRCLKLSNQFRGIDEGESDFLATVAKERQEEERKRRERERDELEAFRRAKLGKGGVGEGEEKVRECLQ